MTVVSKNVHINKMDGIVDKYNNTYYTTIKMKPADVKVDTYFDFDVERGDKDPKVKVDEHVMVSKYKNTFTNRNTPNWHQVDLNAVPWTRVIKDLKVEKVLGTFFENKLQKTNETKFSIEKVLKRKCTEAKMG